MSFKKNNGNVRRFYLKDIVVFKEILGCSVKKIFWCLSVPSSILLAAWCYMQDGVGSLEEVLMAVIFLISLPYLHNSADEMNEKMVVLCQEDFKDLGATEFLNQIVIFKKIPLGQERAAMKEAYCREYYKRYGKNIFEHIPMFGER